MAEVTHNWKTFYIPDEIQSQYPDLVKLILNTESMDDDEKQYWFDILPSMTDEQVDKLYNILETERKKLEELELKYQKEIKTLNEKHLIEWQEFQMKQNKKKIEEEKAKDKDKDDDESADNILNQLNNL